MNRNTIMLVEDNPDHALLAVDALERTGHEVEIEVLNDGAAALDRLAEHAAADLPKVILLDIKMPGLSGFDVLRRLKADERLRCIPVVMLTTSDAARDVAQSYALGSNSYVQKPVGAEALNERLSHIPDYWLDVNTPPPPPEQAA